MHAWCGFSIVFLQTFLYCQFQDMRWKSTLSHYHKAKFFWCAYLASDSGSSSTTLIVVGVFVALLVIIIVVAAVYVRQ